MEKPVIIDSYEVKVRPAPLWRRLLFGYIPYWQSSEPKLEIILTAIEDCPIDKTLQYMLRFSNGDTTSPRGKSISQLKKGQSCKLIVGNMPLYFTGDSILMVRESGEFNYKRAFVFNTTSRGWMFLVIVVAILSAVATTLVNWLFG